MDFQYLMFEREERTIICFLLYIIFLLNIFLIGKSKFFSFCGSFSHYSFTNCDWSKGSEELRSLCHSIVFRPFVIFWYKYWSYSLGLLPRDNQVFSTWAKHQGIRGISTTEKQKKRVGVLEVPSSSFKLMKNSTYLKE